MAITNRDKPRSGGVAAFSVDTVDKIQVYFSSPLLGRSFSSGNA